eukprot:scaffold134680_cov50-Cyclotella_meneghiniana.AAC.1
MAVLQSRYSTLQHKIDKQAPHKSIKSWFEDTSGGDNHDLWWRSKIRVPENVREEWGLISTCYTSGEFPLTRYEMDILDVRFENDDMLKCLCGEYKTNGIVDCETSTTYFKTKKAAQKSAALNLLLELELGSIRSNEKEDGEDILDPLNDLDVIENDNVANSGRFQLESLKYMGQLIR